MVFATTDGGFNVHVTAHDPDPVKELRGRIHERFEGRKNAATATIASVTREHLTVEEREAHAAELEPDARMQLLRLFDKPLAAMHNPLQLCSVVLDTEGQQRSACGHALEGAERILPLPAETTRAHIQVWLTPQGHHFLRGYLNGALEIAFDDAAAPVLLLALTHIQR